jgi:hypothetical protein
MGKAGRRRQSAGASRLCGSRFAEVLIKTHTNAATGLPNAPLPQYPRMERVARPRPYKAMMRSLNPSSRLWPLRTICGAVGGRPGPADRHQAVGKVNGYTISDRGRIPQDVVEAFDAAQTAPPVDTTAPAKRPERAKPKAIPGSPTLADWLDDPRTGQPAARRDLIAQRRRRTTDV